MDQGLWMRIKDHMDQENIKGSQSCKHTLQQL